MDSAIGRVVKRRQQRPLVGIGLASPHPDVVKPDSQTGIDRNRQRNTSGSPDLLAIDQVERPREL